MPLKNLKTDQIYAIFYADSGLLFSTNHSELFKMNGFLQLFSIIVLHFFKNLRDS